MLNAGQRKREDQMGSGDDARKAEVDAIMAGGQDSVNRYLITGFMDLKTNGCAQQCNKPKNKVHPALSSSFVATVVIGIIEALKHLTPSK
jgi:hypothetical protein